MMLSAPVRRHLGLDDHAELDVVVAGEDLLARIEAVDGRIFGHDAHIGREEHVRDAEVGQPLAPLFADVALHRGDLDRVAHHVRRAVAVRHDVVADDLHGVERAELAPVGAVAPDGVVPAVEVHVHGQHDQHAAQQNEQIGQAAADGGPVARADRHAIFIDQHRERARVQNERHPGAARFAGDHRAVDERDGEVGDPAEQDEALRFAGHRDVDAEIDGQHKLGNRGAVEPLLSRNQHVEHEDQTG
jgi:hypothetical protein